MEVDSLDHTVGKTSLAFLPDVVSILVLDGLERNSLLSCSAAARSLCGVGRSDSLWIRQQKWRFGPLFAAPDARPGARADGVASAADRAKAEPTLDTGAFAFFHRRARKDCEVRDLLQDLGAPPPQRAAAIRKLLDRGTDALDAVIRERPRLEHLVAAHFAFVVERRLVDLWAGQTLQELISDPQDGNLEEGALILAQWHDPARCDPGEVRAELDSLADSAQAWLAAQPSEVRDEPRETRRYEDKDLFDVELSAAQKSEAPIDLLRAVVHVLFVDRGFRGAEHRDGGKGYCNHLNSFLPHVLRRRVGIPISLGTLFACVGRRIGLRCGLLASIPAHVLVCVFGAGPSGDPLFLDAFHRGACLQKHELDSFVGARLPPEVCEPSHPASVFGRMLRNLFLIFEGEVKQWPGSDDKVLSIFGCHHLLVCLSSASATTMRVSRVDWALLRLSRDPILLEAAMDGLTEEHVKGQILDALREARAEADGNLLLLGSKPTMRGSARFPVGSVVLHRAGRLCAIVGYTETCEMAEHGKEGIFADSLSLGLSQPWYLCLIEGLNRMGYIAEANIELVSPTMPPRKGLLVELVGLSNRPDLNGARARVMRQAPGSVPEGCIPCRLEGRNATVVSVPENKLRVLSTPISHPTLWRYFARFDSASGAYVPNAELSEACLEG
eukprot:TRINITY_DN10050_c0_g1_i2.p1 TRINITY_DN10050_c0_g1~~TRINITY_DN10050_c0_g1_i2.p1  ORF type:complete len:669 (-),score=78.92 TRINITY_DN10050_c0_g1_i2:172-2178(-)